MGRTIKITTFVISTLLLLFVIGAIALLTFVDPNRFKDPIIHQVEQATGRQVTIKGDLSWSFLPTLGIQVEDVSIANPAGFKESTFLHISSLDIRVKILPLLKKRMQLGKIILHDPTLNLIRNAQGQTNWTFTCETPPSSTNATTTRSAKASSQPHIAAIDNLKVTTAVIHWNDAINAQSTTFTIPSLNLNAFNQEQPIKVHFNFTAENNQPYWIAQGKISTTVLLSANNIELHKLTFTSKATNDPDDLNAVELNAQTNKLTYNWLTQAINTGTVQGNFANMPFITSLKGTLGKQPQLQGNLRIPTFNLPKWLAQLNMSNPLQHNQASATLNVNLQNNQWKLAPFNLSLDKMRMQGAVSYDNDQHLIDLELKANTFDLSKLKKRKSTQPLEKARAFITQEKAQSSPHSMADWLQQYQIKGEVAIDNVQINKVIAQDVHTSINGAKGKLQLNTLANFYQGLMKSNLMVDFNNTQPQYHLQESLDNVEIKPLFQALNIKKAPTGTASLNADLTSQGDEIAQIQQRLNGSFDFHAVNGAIKGLNLVKLLNQAANVALRGGKLSTSDLTTSSSLSPQEGDTAFSSLSAKWTIKQGIASNDDLLFQSPLINAKGYGTINLVNGGLHYYLAIQTVAHQLPAVDQLEQLIGGTIKIKFGCTIMKPCRELKLNIDSATLIKNMGALLKPNGKTAEKNPLQNIKLPALFH